jgi:hypothetical protein
MAAFAAEDDELPTSSRTQGMSARVPARPASAPVPEARPRGFGKEREAPGPSRLRPDSMDDEPTASVSTSGPTPAPTPRRDARPPVPVATPVLAPAVVLEDREASASMASSPLASPSVRPVAARTPRGGSSARPVPTSTFNFSIPTSILPPHPPAAVQATPVGSKRPIVAVDTEMADGTPGTPSRSSRKRRNMHGPEAEEKEKERANRRHHRRGGGLA